MGIECLQPVRDANYPAHEGLRKVLTLSGEIDADTVSFNDALNAWSIYIGENRNILAVKSTDRARKLLMAAFGIDDGEPVGIPANTRRPLSEAVKRSKGTPAFIELDRNLEFVPETPGIETARLVWAQPVAGMAAPAPIEGKTLFVDYAFTLPAPEPEYIPGAATVFGLHLSDNMREDGALIVFNDVALYNTAQAMVDPENDLPDAGRMMAQLNRVAGDDGLAARQLANYRAATEGLLHAGALPQAETSMSPALPFGLVIRIPDEADVATFISYVRNENLVLDWMPEIQPMFYVVNQVTKDRALTGKTAEHLARWVISPIGPGFIDDEITHAVLGPVKAAEYTGVRWYTNLERARWYNDLMLEWYGPTHDAYRAAFLHDLAEADLVPADD